ncbi:hypothetical protein TSUD_04710 [Trifolium subterraneum]|nr:hypothetical protein TSUD_04710 [Trifolium subterraneum]
MKSATVVPLEARGLFFGNSLSLFVAQAEFSRPVQSVLQIMQRTSDYYHVCKSSRTVTMTPKAVRWIGWQPPEVGWVKVNTDGESKDEGIEAVVGLLKIIYEILQR